MAKGINIYPWPFLQVSDGTSRIACCYFYILMGVFDGVPVRSYLMPFSFRQSAAERPSRRPAVLGA